MGGRGSSSGRSRSGGGAVVTPPIQQQPQVDNTKTNSVIEQGDFSKFMSATDDQKADMIMKLTKQAVPVFLANNDFQKLIFGMGMNDKPKVISDSQLDKIKGQELFRTVNNVRDAKNGITYDADMIAGQIVNGKVTRVSDSGGSAYGRGIYFANSYRESALYGNTSGNIRATAVVRAKLDANAKTISHSSASAGVSKEINSGSKLGKALAKCDSYSRVSIYALSKGYDVLTSGHGYYNVLTRKSLVMSSDIKARSSKWK